MKETINEIKVILKHSIKIAIKHDFIGIKSFDKFKNKKSSGYYLTHKIKDLKEDDFFFGRILELSNDAKSDVLNSKYSRKIQSLISYIQEVSL